MQLSPSILESLNLLLIYFTQLWLLSVSIGFYNQGQGFPTLLLHAAAAESLQSCPTLCDPIHGSPPGSSVPGILQARILEWVAISFSNAWKWTVKVKLLSRAQLLATPWTAAYQAPPSMGFSKQEYWKGVPLPSPLLLCTLLQILYQLMNTKTTTSQRGWNRKRKAEMRTVPWIVNKEYHPSMLIYFLLKLWLSFPTFQTVSYMKGRTVIFTNMYLATST